MPLYDLLIRNGTLALPDAPTTPGDLAIADGRIVAIGEDVEGGARADIDASGLVILPGVIDAHVHFNEPGRVEWEGFATGTRALAAGGTTTFIDMPLNAHPPTLDARSFDLKYRAAEAASLVDFALWGGLVPGDLDRLDELAARGVVGFKAFMSNSGISDFEAVDDLTLLEGMARAARRGKIVAVHAKSDQITARQAARAVAEGRTGVRDYLRSRPAVAELEAIGRAITFASETGCALHIVHVSTGRGVELVAAARARGVDVSCETCPHYLVLAEDDMERLGAIAKCAPPLRDQAEQDALWQHLSSGTLPMVASDHSPAPPEMKRDRDFFKVWGGISGCQSLLPLLLSEGYYRRGLDLPTLARATSTFVARRFGLDAHKGRLAVAVDADIVLVDLDASAILGAEDLQYRHRHSPYVGRRFTGQVVRTLVRGTTTFLDGAIVSGPIGRLVRPDVA